MALHGLDRTPGRTLGLRPPPVDRPDRINKVGNGKDAGQDRGVPGLGMDFWIQSGEF